MKFKAQDKQNQLIENITVHHLVVGVDIAQETHVARAVNFRGIALGHPLEFSNDEVGFHKEVETVLVNPHLVKKNKENRHNTRSKSDKKDALVIADMVKNGYYSPVGFHSAEYEELRVLMANRETVVKRLVRAVNQIHRGVDPTAGESLFK
ncbi:hypothetical protein GCM10020370_49660 [Paenibacillus hodogayensis]